MLKTRIGKAESQVTARQRAEARAHGQAFTLWMERNTTPEENDAFFRVYSRPLPEEMDADEARTTLDMTPGEFREWRRLLFLKFGDAQADDEQVYASVCARLPLELSG